MSSDDSDKLKPKWHHPSEVMKLHNLKIKKRALQARIKGDTPNQENSNVSSSSNSISQKRRNPFAINQDNKRTKHELDESTDQTLFKIIHQNNTSLPLNNSTLTSFENILSKINTKETVKDINEEKGEAYLPLDWTMKRKLRLWSPKPFPWNQKLKISEEASGITGFARCLDIDNNNKLDTSPNSRFHQCCLYWQHPSLPWIPLFPRVSGKISESGASIASNSQIRSALQTAWTDSFRSLFQLIRTKQCPYFYVCANGFTTLFRAAGICGFSDCHILITPTTRGFRQLLKQEEIEFTMPLKKKGRNSDQGYETLDSTVQDTPVEDVHAEDEDDVLDEEWMKSMGISAKDIKQINYTQAKIVHKAECEVDNSEQSLVLIEGVEVHAFYNFFINCKSITVTTGPLAGIPPTLLAPVAFTGATLHSLKVRESKVHVDNTDFYSLELTGPILPSTVFNLFSINPTEHNMSATFANLTSTNSFNKVSRELSLNSKESKCNPIFDKENLSDCGLPQHILERFCLPHKISPSIECLKYHCDTKTYTWT